MTQQQAETLDRALQRARQNGLSVLGAGEWARGGRFFVVGSASQPGAHHVVSIYAGRLACDCKGGQHGRTCQHRALAHEQLQREAVEAAIRAGFADAERMNRDAHRRLADLEVATRAYERDTAMPAAALAPARKFSVFKV